MKKTFVPVIMTILLLTVLEAPAATVDQRVRELETRQAEIYHTLRQQKEAGRMTLIGEGLTLSGLIEFEAGYESLSMVRGDAEGHNKEEDERSSDFVLATAQLGIEARINEVIDAAIVLLYSEGDGDSPEVDEAILNYSREGWKAGFGRQYLPFGVFPSHMISDPLTLELGEIRETAVWAGYENDLISARIFLYNGEVEKEGDSDKIGDWGASVSVSPAGFISLGVGYISDIADTEAGLVETYTSLTSGISAFTTVSLGPFELTGEILGAAGDFGAADLDGDGDGLGDRPFAWNAEVSWDIREDLEMAARLEGSSEFSGNPELQYGFCISWSPWEYISISAEYLRGEYDGDFGRGIDRRDLVTTQLAAEF